jgi:hypothetical protein
VSKTEGSPSPSAYISPSWCALLGRLNWIPLRLIGGAEALDGRGPDDVRQTRWPICLHWVSALRAHKEQRRGAQVVPVRGVSSLVLLIAVDRAERSQQGIRVKAADHQLERDRDRLAAWGAEQNDHDDEHDGSRRARLDSKQHQLAKQPVRSAGKCRHQRSAVQARQGDITSSWS